MEAADPAGAGFRTSLADGIAAWRRGEDPDLEGLLGTLWTGLYARLPALTVSRGKEDQHRILQEFLVGAGLPDTPDLQYIAGPVLWYAREKGVLPPAQTGDGPPEPWTLDERKFEAARADLAAGAVAYGDWMRDALRTILAEQQ